VVAGECKSRGEVQTRRVHTDEFGAEHWIDEGRALASAGLGPAAEMIEEKFAQR
jgi:hypothetical protein